MNILTLIVDGIEIPFDAADELEQSYDVLGGRTTRFMSGRLAKQTHWQKLRVEMSGSGRIPVGLSAVDTTGAFQLHCVTALAISTPSLNLTLPRAFRTDTPPWATAQVGINSVLTPVSVDGLDVNITPVPGARFYLVNYLPILNVFATSGVGQSNNVYQTRHGWSLTVEEI